MSEQASKIKSVKNNVQTGIDFASFDVTGVVREITEKSVTQAKETYEKVKAAAEEATDIMEDTYTTTIKGIAELNLKTLEATRANINSAFDFARDLLTVRSVSEAVELQTSHARKQFGIISGQAKELSKLAGKVATEASSPVKEGVQKAFKNVA